MHFDDYQRRAGVTDQNPRPEGATGEASREPHRHEVIPLLGLVGEIGGLLGEYKKLLRDGATHRKFRDEVAEELGDVLWYVSNVATKFNLCLSEIAEQNLTKVEDRWRTPERRRALYDEHLIANQQLPRRFEYAFEDRTTDGITKVVLIDRSSGDSTGDPLTDNSYEDDGYRFHDVIHLALAACLGWSPVLRKLLRTKDSLDHRAPREVDEVEDGGRAQVIEEAIVAAAYVYASNHDYLDGVDAVDWQLLRHLKQLTSYVEVRNRTAREWNDALLAGFAVWRKLRERGRGTVRGDLVAGTLEFIPPP
jgi:NTP pyrophosphatase (non-canonical NTP hydrolase)